jgi:hypothetical protein
MNNITQKYISFFSTIDMNLKIDKSEKYSYFILYNWNTENIVHFLQTIRGDDIFLMFPFITNTKRPSDAYLRLSEQFLISNRSNPKLICDFLDSQWSNSGFELNQDSQAFLYIKYKKVYFEEINFLK